jgi:hypothetical protein
MHLHTYVPGSYAKMRQNKVSDISSEIILSNNNFDILTMQHLTFFSLLSELIGKGKKIFSDFESQLPHVF